MAVQRMRSNYLHIDKGLRCTLVIKKQNKSRSITLSRQGGCKDFNYFNRTIGIPQQRWPVMSPPSIFLQRSGIKGGRISQIVNRTRAIRSPITRGATSQAAVVLFRR